MTSSWSHILRLSALRLLCYTAAASYALLECINYTPGRWPFKSWDILDLRIVLINRFSNDPCVRASVLVTVVSKQLHFRSNFGFKSVFFTEWPPMQYPSSPLTWLRTKILLKWNFFLMRALLMIPVHVFRIELCTFLHRYIVYFNFLSFINDIFCLYVLCV